MRWRQQKAESGPEKPANREVPGLGRVERVGIEGEDEYVSDPIPVSALGAEVEFFVEGYDEDEHPEDFHAAIEAFLDLDRSALEAAADLFFACYQDIRRRVEAHDGYDDEDTVPDIAGPGDVLDHVEPGFEATVARDTDGDGEVCVAVACACDWERVHGLQIVFRGGRVVSRVGPFDGRVSA